MMMMMSVFVKLYVRMTKTISYGNESARTRWREACPATAAAPCHHIQPQPCFLSHIHIHSLYLCHCLSLSHTHTLSMSVPLSFSSLSPNFSRSRSFPAISVAFLACDSHSCRFSSSGPAATTLCLTAAAFAQLSKLRFTEPWPARTRPLWLLRQLNREKSARQLTLMFLATERKKKPRQVTARIW
jgi:hypothetical protein